MILPDFRLLVTVALPLFLAGPVRAATIEDICRGPGAPEFCPRYEALSPAQKQQFLRDLLPRHQRQTGRDVGMAMNGAGRAIGQRLQGLRLQMRHPAIRVAPAGMPLSALGTGRGGSAGDDIKDDRRGAFLLGLDESSSQVGDTDQLDYDSARTQVTVGVDYRLGDANVVGIALSRGDSDADLDGDRIRQEGATDAVTLFGSHFIDDLWYVDGYALSGSADYDTSREVLLGPSVVLVTSEAGGSSTGAGMSLGADLGVAGWGYGAYGRLDYSRIKVDAYGETGPGGLGLLIDAQRIDNTQATLGVQVNKVLSSGVGVWIPQANLEVVHDSQDGVRTISGRVRGPDGVAPLSYETPEQDTTHGSASLSVTGTFARGWSGFVRASAQLWRDDGYDSRMLEAGTRAEF